MNREDIIRMALETMPYEDGNYFVIHSEELERFAALVEAHVNAKEKERQRYDIHSCGPDCDRYICVAVRKAREEEREGCILALERNADKTLEEIIDAIRARSST